jgi:trigger factor
MKSTLTTLSDNKVKITVTVEAPDMDEAINKTADRLAKQVSIKGFRKGKVPRQVLETHVGGREALRGEALQDSLPDFYAMAISDLRVDPISRPDIDIVSGETDGDVIFDAEVEVRPDVTVSGYQDLRVTIPSPAVSDADIDAQIDRWRDVDAVLNDVDRGVQEKDVVQMDVKIDPIDPEEGESGFSMDDYMYTVGSGTIAEAVDELILGLTAGEELKLNERVAPGKTSTFTLTLKQVKEKVLPELTDEWVANNTDYADVASMREGIAQQMGRMRVVEAQLSQRDAVLTALAELIDPELAPEALVNQETQERLHDLGHRLANQKLDLETFLRVTNQSQEELLQKLQDDARLAVRVDLGLRALAVAEKLEASSEEVGEELIKTAMSMNYTPEVLDVELRKAGRTKAFIDEVTKTKASKWLMSNVIYVDPQGVEIDKELLTQPQNEGFPSMPMGDL